MDASRPALASRPADASRPVEASLLLPPLRAARAPRDEEAAVSADVEAPADEEVPADDDGPADEEAPADGLVGLADEEGRAFDDEAADEAAPAEDEAAAPDCCRCCRSARLGEPTSAELSSSSRELPAARRALAAGSGMLHSESVGASLIRAVRPSSYFAFLPAGVGKYREEVAALYLARVLHEPCVRFSCAI